jgi:Zn-dependent M28 family amino/carboxypeptidase
VTRGLAAELERDVRALCALGPRNTWAPAAMLAAADFIEASLDGYRVEAHAYEEGENLIAEIGGNDEIVVVGAHYDTVEGSPGADDNASGVAALIAIARASIDARPKRTLRFAFFANEEPPHFQTQSMGSWRYARRCRDRRERVVAMLSLESLGYYDDAPGTQQYPPLMAPFYPGTANFIGFAGNLASRALVKECTRSFRRHSSVPAESAALPELVPEIGWSDQWAFWRCGWPALMVTDTAPFRNPHYHASTDTPDTLDYERLARVTEGLIGVVQDLM